MTLTCPTCEAPLELDSLTVARSHAGGAEGRCYIVYRCKTDRTLLSRTFFRFHRDGKGHSCLVEAAEAGWWPMPVASTEYSTVTDADVDATTAAYDRAVQGAVDALQRIAKITGDVANLTDLGHALNPDEAAHAVRGVLASLLRLQDRLEQEKEGEQA